jgi:hypothetical protein
MTELQPTVPIAAELKAIKAIAAALAALTESQGRDDVFYISLELSRRLDDVSDSCDRQLEEAKANSDRGV